MGVLSCAWHAQVILFPFLFAIMFGDVGHGLLLVLLALFFIANEAALGKQQLDDIVGMMFGGRYVLLLNGLFAMYIGFVYNEAFSVPLGLFNSTWRPIEGAPGAMEWDGTVYPFGVDPMWHKAENKMSFFNSYKMKVSIVFGVCQMALGISCSLLNCLHYQDRRSIWFGFVPEMTFFLAIFGYLVFMILRKWSVDWVGEAKRPPSLLNTLIAMFMSPGVYTEEDRLYAGQEDVQLLLMLMAVVAVPFLLVPKPLLHYWDMKAKARAEAAALLGEGGGVEMGVGANYVATRPDGSMPPVPSPPPSPSAEAGASGDPGPSSAAGGAAEAAAAGGEAAEAAAAEEGGGGEEEEEEEGEGELGEVVVHQVIHTIEFVLGSISNTASYLRLWALSLAHSQLSELFWEKVMKEQAFPAAKLPAPLNGIALMCLFSTWVILNLGVLMVMENLSSFLHALRLQWVEFQNKFYNGDGYKFKPFSFAALTDSDAD